MIRAGNYSPGEHVPEVVWQKLTDDHSSDQAIFTELTSQTFIDRYRSDAWKKGAPTVTTRSLWERFAKQLSLPKLASESTLLVMLRKGQEEKRFGVGELETDTSSIANRNSYLALYRGHESPGPNVPALGQRWVVIDNDLYTQLSQSEPKPVIVDAAQLFAVVQDLLPDGDGKSIPVPAVTKHFKDANPGLDVDINSVLQAIKDAVGDGLIVCKTAKDATIAEQEVHDAKDLSMIQSLALPAGVKKGTVTVSASGELELSGIGPLFKELLQPLNGQKPKTMRIRVNVTAIFDSASGAGLDTIVEEAKSRTELKGLSIDKK